MNGDPLSARAAWQAQGCPLPAWMSTVREHLEAIGHTVTPVMVECGVIALSLPSGCGATAEMCEAPDTVSTDTAPAAVTLYFRRRDGQALDGVTLHRSPSPGVIAAQFAEMALTPPVSEDTAMVGLRGYTVTLHVDPNSGDMRVSITTPDGYGDTIGVDVNDERVYG